MPPADHVICLSRAGWLQLCFLPRSSTTKWWEWVCPNALVSSRSRSRDRWICSSLERQQPSRISCDNDSSKYHRHHGPRRENVTNVFLGNISVSLPLTLVRVWSSVCPQLLLHVFDPSRNLLTKLVFFYWVISFNELNTKTNKPSSNTIHLPAKHNQKFSRPNGITFVCLSLLWACGLALMYLNITGCT